MNKIQYSLWGSFLMLTGTWFLTDSLLPDPLTYFSFRSSFLQYSGVIAIGAMSIAMVLALRLRWLERCLGGLDKVYRLHKWLGIGALVAGIVHWWWAAGSKWMVGWGWLVRPERRHRGKEALSPIEEWLHTQRDLAEQMGEWAFYAAVILIVLALIKRFPYHLFRKTHHWLAVIYLLLVFHTIVLTHADYWLEPIGGLMALLLTSGSISALLVLSGQVGRGHKVHGVIESLDYYPGVHVIESSIRVESGWHGHKAGQYAFVTSNKREGAHPYTIASAWDPNDTRLTFIAKELGDWTGQLHDRLQIGMPITVEGPYGCFDFNDQNLHQIWIGAGIGITPFIARLQQLTKTPGRQKIDLFHVTRDYDARAMEKLAKAASDAKVDLHLIRTPIDGHLTPAQIREQVSDWPSASIWYCGPALFGSLLRSNFIANGMAARDIHQELFEMR